jgi:hypothetical protein
LLHLLTRELLRKTTTSDRVGREKILNVQEREKLNVCDRLSQDYRIRHDLHVNHVNRVILWQVASVVLEIYGVNE